MAEPGRLGGTASPAVPGRDPAAPMAPTPLPERELKLIGTPFRRVDGWAKVTGATRFADDLAFPRMCFIKLVRSTVPHARLLAVDASAALAMPGVLAVLTGKDLPVTFGILPVSQDEHALALDVVRHVGDPIAAVAATSEDLAHEAALAVQVKYEPLPTISSVEEAIALEEPQIHDYADRGNLHKVVSMEFGAVEAGLAAADRIFEDTLLLRGQHPSADGAALHGGAVRGRGPRHRLVLDPDAALPASRALQSPRHFRLAHPRHRDSQRRRLRRQERPFRTRDRRREDGAHARPAGEDHAHPRGGLLLPPRAPSGADAHENRRHERRHAHRAAPRDHARRRCLRQLRRRLDLLHRRAADGDLQAPRAIASTRSAPSPTSRRAVRSAVTARRSRASAGRCSSTRWRSLWAGIRPTCGSRSSSEPDTVTANWLKIGTIALARCIEAVVAGSASASAGASSPRAAASASPAAPISAAPACRSTGTTCRSRGCSCSSTARGGVAVFCGETEIGQGSDSVLAAIVAEGLGLDLADIQLCVADTGFHAGGPRQLLFARHADDGPRRARGHRAGARARGERGRAAARGAARAAGRSPTAGLRRSAPARGLAWEEAVIAAEARFGTLATTGSYIPPRSPGKYRGAGVGPSPDLLLFRGRGRGRGRLRDRHLDSASSLDRARHRRARSIRRWSWARSKAPFTWGSAKR